MNTCANFELSTDQMEAVTGGGETISVRTSTILQPHLPPVKDLVALPNLSIVGTLTQPITHG